MGRSAKSAGSAIAGAAFCALAALAVLAAAFGPRILSYAHAYTTTVSVALVISAIAAAPPALLNVVASERA